MKKLLQVGALSLALLASLFMLSNHADAASTAGNVSLKINTGTSSCSVGGTGWTTNVGTASFAVQYVTGAINSNFSCTDYDGVYQWNMQIIMTSDLTGSNAGSTPIPRANVTMAAYANSVTAGACTAGSNTTTFTSIGSVAGTVLQKSGNTGDICTITSTGVRLQVQVPASQAVGTYTGTLSITTYR